MMSALSVNQNRQRVLPAEREQGAILVVVLVLVFAVTLALLAFLYLNKNNSLIAANLAVQNAAQEATDAGMSAATAALQSTVQPTILTAMPSTGYLASGVDTSSVPLQAPSDPSFWQNCVSNQQCNSIGTVQYGPYNFSVAYTVFQLNGVPSSAALAQGYEQQSVQGNNTPPPFSFYWVVVHAARSNGGGLGVTVQSVVRVN